jgi:pimeloyl-ACP methyl ester carboxylesterase
MAAPHQMITATSADATEVRAFARGQGPVILVIHPGNDDGRSWRRVAARLSGRFRVVRIVRRQYRRDLPVPAPYSTDREVEDVLALAATLGQPVVLTGHSSGGVVALEALAANPATFAGAVLFEPPVPLGPPAPNPAVDRARAAVAAGRPGRAMQIFVRDVVGMRASDAWAVRLLVAVNPRMRALAPRQIGDLDGLGPRLEVYARIDVPVVLLGGDRSPAHLGEALDALAAALPHARKVILPGRDHMAHMKAPGEVARVIADLTDAVLRQGPG